MKSILVPTDFSVTAQNAAEYAIGFAKQLQIDNIILVNCWQPVTVADPMLSVVVSEVETYKDLSLANLKQEVERLKQIAPLHILFKEISALGSLENVIAKTCEGNDVSYIVMGITGGGVIEEKLVGSNTISVSQHTKVPVIIVPQQASYNVITKAMLLCDFSNMDKTLPEKEIVDFLEVVQPQLEVVNFDPDFKREKDAAAFEKFFLHNILRDYRPHYSYSLRNDFEDAVNEFAEINHVQIIINISKKHGWLHRILHPSYTKRLAFHTTVPLMIIHN